MRSEYVVETKKDLNINYETAEIQSALKIPPYTSIIDWVQCCDLYGSADEYSGVCESTANNETHQTPTVILVPPVRYNETHDTVFDVFV